MEMQLALFLVGMMGGFWLREAYEAFTKIYHNIESIRQRPPRQ
jgi:hypothetical protein